MTGLGHKFALNRTFKFDQKRNCPPSKARCPPPSPRPFAICFNNPINGYWLLAYFCPRACGQPMAIFSSRLSIPSILSLVSYFQMWTKICLPGAPLQILQRQSSCVKCRTHRLCKMSLRSCVKVLTR